MPAHNAADRIEADDEARRFVSDIEHMCLCVNSQSFRCTPIMENTNNGKTAIRMCRNREGEGKQEKYHAETGKCYAYQDIRAALYHKCCAAASYLVPKSNF